MNILLLLCIFSNSVFNLPRSWRWSHLNVTNDKTENSIVKCSKLKSTFLNQQGFNGCKIKWKYFWKRKLKSSIMNFKFGIIWQKHKNKSLQPCQISFWVHTQIDFLEMTIVEFEQITRDLIYHFQYFPLDS